MNKKRIVFHAVLLVVSTGVFLQQMAIRSTAQEKANNEQTIRVLASTFEFKPSEVILINGVPVTLELVSQDRHQDFKVVEFHFEADIQPGIVEKIRLPASSRTAFFAFSSGFKNELSYRSGSEPRAFCR